MPIEELTRKVIQAILFGCRCRHPIHFEVCSECLCREYAPPTNRRLRLSDILLAIYKVNPTNKTLVTVEADGQFIIYDPLNNSRYAKETWNLNNDDLGHQSKPMHKLLIGLLVKE